MTATLVGSVLRTRLGRLRCMLCRRRGRSIVGAQHRHGSVVADACDRHTGQVLAHVQIAARYLDEGSDDYHVWWRMGMRYVMTDAR